MSSDCSDMYSMSKMQENKNNQNYNKKLGGKLKWVEIINLKHYNYT